MTGRMKKRFATLMNRNIDKIITSMDSEYRDLRFVALRTKDFFKDGNNITGSVLFGALHGITHDLKGWDFGDIDFVKHEKEPISSVRTGRYQEFLTKNYVFWHEPRPYYINDHVDRVLSGVAGGANNEHEYDLMSIADQRKLCKMQIIYVKPHSTLIEFLKDFDLSPLANIWDGTNLYMEDIDGIIKKRCKLNPMKHVLLSFQQSPYQQHPHEFCSAIHMQIISLDRPLQRLFKYINRGFNITIEYSPSKQFEQELDKCRLNEGQVVNCIHAIKMFWKTLLIPKGNAIDTWDSKEL